MGLNDSRWTRISFNFKISDEVTVIETRKKLTGAGTLVWNQTKSLLSPNA